MWGGFSYCAYREGSSGANPKTDEKAPGRRKKETSPALPPGHRENEAR